jgi:hypothetical protein
MPAQTLPTVLRHRGLTLALLTPQKGTWYESLGGMTRVHQIASIIIIGPAVSRERCWSSA